MFSIPKSVASAVCHELKSFFPCSSFDPSQATLLSVGQVKSPVFGLWHPNTNFLLKGSSRNCQPDGGRLVSHQKKTVEMDTETGPKTFCIDIVGGRCYFFLLFAILMLFNVISLPILTFR